MLVYEHRGRRDGIVCHAGIEGICINLSREGILREIVKEYAEPGPNDRLSLAKDLPRYAEPRAEVVEVSVVKRIAIDQAQGGIIGAEPPLRFMNHAKIIPTQSSVHGHRTGEAIGVLNVQGMAILGRAAICVARDDSI